MDQSKSSNMRSHTLNEDIEHSLLNLAVIQSKVERKKNGKK